MTIQQPARFATFTNMSEREIANGSTSTEKKPGACL